MNPSKNKSTGMRINHYYNDLPLASHPPSFSTMSINHLDLPQFPFKQFSHLPKISYALENFIVSLVTLFTAFIDCIITIYFWIPIGLIKTCLEYLNTSNEKYLENKTKVIIISGASSGIGASLVKIYSANSNNVLILLGRNPNRLNQSAKLARISGCKAVETHSIDYSHESAQDAIRNLIRSTHLKYGSIDIVFSNAGTWTFTDDDAHGPEPWGEKTVLRLNKINVVSTYTFIMTAWEIMKKQKSGNICIISSILGFQGPPQFAAYSAAKANLLSFASSLRSLSTAYNIGVSCICPGYIKTGMTKDSLAAGSSLPQMLMGDSNDLAKRIKQAVDFNHPTVIWPIHHAIPNLVNLRLNFLNADLFKWVSSKTGLNGQMVS